MTLTDSLSGKSVVFFCPKFFGYEKEIKAEMERQGAVVFFRSAQTVEHPWWKGFIRLFPKLAWPISDLFYFSWLRNSAPESCDIIFVIKGEGLSPRFIRGMKRKYPAAKFVLYLFDGLKNCKFVQEKFRYFDRTLSFDPLDCQNVPALKYRPLFFLSKYLATGEQKANRRKAGLFFLGTLNGDRPQVVARVARVVDPAQFKYFLYVRSRLELKLRALLDASLRTLDESRLFYVPMSSGEIAEKVNNAVAVLDIEHTRQTGLTIRTFEVLASGKKLVTTNSWIARHEFYDPTRICVIDRTHPQLPKDFLLDSVPLLPKSFVAKYSITGWLREILFDTVAPT